MYTKEELASKAFDQCPDDSTSGLVAAFRKIEKKDQYFQTDLADLMNQAAAEAKRETPVRSISHKLQLGYRDLITRDQICDYLQEEIQTVRLSLLDQEDSLSEIEAEKWVLKEMKKNIKEISSKKLPGPLATEIQEKTGYRISFEYPGTEYPFRREEGGFSRSAVSLCYGTTFFKAVYGPVKRLAVRSGFRESDILKWVLTDKRPKPKRLMATAKEFRLEHKEFHLFVETVGVVFYPWSRELIDAVRTGDHKKASAVFEANKSTLKDEHRSYYDSYVKDPPRIIVEINLKTSAADLTFDEVYGAYKAVRELPTQRKQKVNELHFRVYELVRERGGVPTSEKRQFWEEIRRELVREGFKRVPTWEGVRKAYSRLPSD